VFRQSHSDALRAAAKSFPILQTSWPAVVEMRRSDD
jgi:hypothetical protein